MDVVCLHGALSRPASWDGFAAAASARGHRVQALPLLGHLDGTRRRRYRLESFRDDLLARVAELPRYALIGHSLGGYLATLIAQAHPERLSALVLEDPPVPPRRRGDGPLLGKPWMRPMLRLGGVATRRADPRMMGQVLNQLYTPQPQWWAGLDTITAPTLILAGGSRSHLAQPRLSLLAERLPDARVLPIPVGHRIHTHDPARFAEVVLDFLSPTETKDAADAA